jgi:hypothetical protein
LHAQSSARSLARPDWEKERHGVHSALPLALLKVPAAHGEHGPPSAPVKPGSQTHRANSPLRGGDEEFPGHCVHTALPRSAKVSGAQPLHVSARVALGCAEAVPGGQKSHAALPLDVL